MARSYELPTFGNAEYLPDEEVRRFSEFVVWGAADYLMDNGSFKRNAYPGQIKEEEKVFESPNGEKRVKLYFSASKAEEQEKGQSGPLSSCTAYISLSVWRPRLGKEIPAHKRQGDVWDTKDFCFSWPEDDFYMDRYYDYLDNDAEEVERLSRKEEQLLEQLNRKRDIELHTFQKRDCVEVYNILLALDIPPEAMSYAQWEMSLPFSTK